MWKKIHVELEFLRPEFFLAFFSPNILLCADLKTKSSNHPPNVQLSNRSSSILRSSSVHRSSLDFFLPLFFVRSFFLFFFKSAFNRPIGAPAFFVLPLFIVPLQIYSSFVLHQIVLLVLLQVCCSSSTKIKS